MNIGKESEKVEFKTSTSEKHEAVESIVAMLNKSGDGVIYFGVLDDGEVKGQPISDSTIKDITNIIAENVQPKITPTIEHLIIDKKHVLKVSFHGTSKPYSAFGKFLIRIGSENRKMGRDEIINILKETTYTLSWEKEITEHEIEDIDEKTLDEFYREGVNSGRIPTGFDKLSLLKMLDLIKDGYLNRAGYALFGKNANIRLKIARFATNEKITFTDLKFYNDNIYNLIDDAMQYLLNAINYSVDIGLIQRVEIPEIPIRALREIVINAFAHADYRDDPEIEINIHPGFITIYNPGPFPDNLTPFNFIEDSISSIKRNPLILDVLFRRKDVEKSGTGFKRVNELCKKQNIKWSFKNTAYGFYFTFFRNSIEEETNSKNFNIDHKDLNNTELVVYELINKNVRIKKSEIEKITGLSERTIQRYISSLTKKGYIIRIGSNQIGYFEILK
jgi:ATP-dependent DNA helicase RecG